MFIIRCCVYLYVHCHVCTSNCDTNLLQELSSDQIRSDQKSSANFIMCELLQYSFGHNFAKCVPMGQQAAVLTSFCSSGLVRQKYAERPIVRLAL